MKKILFFLMMVQIYASFSQNLWQPIASTQQSNFRMQDSAYITHCIRIDSFQIDTGDSLFYFNKVAKTVNANAFSPMHWQGQGQFLYQKMRKKNNGIYVFEDTTQKVSIYTQANIGQTWLFDSVQNITAQVIDIQLENVLGVNDSVKTILLSSNDTLRLSQHYGFTDFFTYHLTGIQNSNMGEQVPMFADIYNFQVGDVFQYTGYYNSSWSNVAVYTYTKRTVLSRKDSAGGFVYTYEEWKRDSTINYSSSQNTVSQHYFHTFPQDMFFPNTFSYNLEDALPHEVVYLNGNNNILAINTLKPDTNGVMTKGYNKNYDLSANPYPYLSNELWNYVDFKEWKAGLGKSYSYTYGYSTLNSETLTGYIKNGIEYGHVSQDSTYAQPLAITLAENSLSVNIYPNPCNDKVFIYTENAPHFLVQIHDFQGKLLLEQVFQDTHNALLNTQNLHGIYLLTVKNNEKSFVTKLVVN